jgi:dsRNA-specific ribonuclease
MNRAQELSKLLGLAESAPSLLSVALTHESALGSRVDASVAKALLGSLRAVGHSALEAAIVECCLAENGLSDQALINIRLPELSRRVEDGLISRFDLVAATQIGGGFANTNFADQETFRSSLTCRFLGVVVVCSSFDAVRNLVKAEIGISRNRTESQILEAKSCLQEITQRLFKTQPVYELMSSTGPDHDKVFLCKASISPGVWQQGSGKTVSAAQAQAALAIIQKEKLFQRAPDIVQKYSGTPPSIGEARGMSTSSLNPAPAAVRLAEKLQAVLDCEFMDIGHLAVALSLSNRSSGDLYDTHFRHKMIGSAIEELAFAIYAYRTIQQDLIASEVADWSQFKATVRSPIHYARLYKSLELEKYIYGHATGPLSPDRQADVIKAISGAAFLSVGDFDKVYDWMERVIGPWLSSYLSDLLIHPWKLHEPKSLLQEVIQATGCFEIQYVSEEAGPDHELTFRSVVVCNRIGEKPKSYLGRGQASSKIGAQKHAAKNSIVGLMPRGKDKPFFEIAPAIWQSCIERALSGKASLPRLGLPLHLRMFRSVRVYSELKALLSEFPNLLPYFSSPRFVQMATSSASQASPFPINRIRDLTLQGIDFWTGISPENSTKFLSEQSSEWLRNFHSLSNRLKIPAAPASWPLVEVEPTDLTGLLRMRNLRVRLGKSGTIPSSSFAHLATLLESLDEEAHSSTDVAIQFARPDEFQVAVIAIPKSHFTPLRCSEVICALDPQAFFLGTEVSLRQASNSILICVKTVCPTKKTPYGDAFFSILQGMYDKLRGVQSLYRVLHDLKNQMIALQNYARLISADQRMKYQYLARIDDLQRELTGCKHSVTALFQAVDETRGTFCDLFKTFQEFASRELYSLSDKIQLRLDTSIDPGRVRVDADHILSVLSNLTRNAVEAMPNGGDLSITAIYLRNDRQFLVEVADTGMGIPSDKLKGLFDSLQSTKKGMGLGLATVNHIVKCYEGRIEVDSKVGRGTKFSIFLPLEGIA